MSGQQSKNRGGWDELIATFLFVVLVGVWALIPSRVLEETWHAESKQMEVWVGPETEMWIRSKTLAAISEVAKDAENAARDLGESKIDRWLADRIYASFMWIATASHRAYTFMIWMILGVPLFLAALVDGFYVREIRKAAFISQSPIRHRIGIRFFHLVSIALILWLFIPVSIPGFVAPAVVCFMALSLWLWVGNLQKRL